MIKSTSDGSSPPPKVRLQFKSSAADAAQADAFADVQGAGDWVEATLSTTLPDIVDAESTDARPFDLLSVTCPAGESGRILIDEVTMVVIPDDDFGGGLSQATQLP
jgi:hypothetical protein